MAGTMQNLSGDSQSKLKDYLENIARLEEEKLALQKWTETCRLFDRSVPDPLPAGGRAP